MQFFTGFELKNIIVVILPHVVMDLVCDYGANCNKRLRMDEMRGSSASDADSRQPAVDNTREYRHPVCKLIHCISSFSSYVISISQDDF